MLFTAAPCYGEKPYFSEYQVKAAFLYNFAKFVQWPDSAFVDTDAPFTIAVFDSTPFENAFEIIQTKKAQSRRIEVKLCSKASDLEGCQIAFINPQSRALAEQAAAFAGTRSILTVEETEGDTACSSIILLVVENEHVDFLVNLKAAKNVGLSISSQLLEVAREVR